MFGFVLPVISAISALVGIGTSVFSFMEQESAADEARQIAKEQAREAERAAKAETEEQARRLEAQQSRQRATARARAAASGIDPRVGSTNLFIQEMAKEQQAQLDWLRESGYQRSREERERILSQGVFAESTAQQRAYGSVGAAFSQLPSFIESTGKAYEAIR